jgi:hypothetical protein
MGRPLGRRITTTLWTLGIGWGVAGCSDDGDVTPPPTPAAIEATEEANGNNQIAEAGAQLESPLRVLVTREEQPAEGVEVRWVSQQGGRFNPQTSVSDASGVAQTFWTLGDDAGQQIATARLVDGIQTPVTFTAVATDPPDPGPDPGGPPE